MEETSTDQTRVEEIRELINREEYGKALSKLKEILESGKTEWNQYLQLRRELSASNQVNNLIDEWALYIFIETNQFKHTLPILDRFIVLAPNNARWNYYYALSLHMLKKDMQKALHYYNVAFDNGFEEYWIRYNRGMLLRELGDLDNARIDLQQAATLNPEDKIAQKMLCEIQQSIDSKHLEQLPQRDIDKVQEMVSNSEYQKATVKIQDSLSKFPNNALLNYFYGFCLHMMQKDLDTALSYYNDALLNGFDEFWVKYNRGSLLYDLGDLQAALDDLERALSLKPDHSGATLVLEQIKRSLEDSRITK